MAAFVRHRQRVTGVRSHAAAMARHILEGQVALSNRSAIELLASCSTWPRLANACWSVGLELSSPALGGAVDQRRRSRPKIRSTACATASTTCRRNRPSAILGGAFRIARRPGVNYSRHLEYHCEILGGGRSRGTAAASRPTRRA